MFKGIAAMAIFSTGAIADPIDGCWISIEDSGQTMTITAQADPTHWQRGTYDLRVMTTKSGNISTSQQSGFFDVVTSPGGASHPINLALASVPSRSEMDVQLMVHHEARSEACSIRKVD